MGDDRSPVPDDIGRYIVGRIIELAVYSIDEATCLLNADGRASRGDESRVSHPEMSAGFTGRNKPRFH
jgi:hypothetical protein